MRDISPTKTWLAIVLGMALSGVLYSIIAYPGEPVIVGAVFAVSMGIPLIGFERRVFLRAIYRRIERFPTFGFVVSTLFIYELLMSFGFALAASLFWWLGMLRPAPFLDVIVMPFQVFLYAIAVCGLIIFILRVRDLLGRDVFISMLTGRYRHPVREERIFLFIDLANSTPFAEKHGDLRVQQLLKTLFAAFAEPVRRHKGSIDDYVGDAAIITWPLSRGVENSRCIRCVFDILEEIEAKADKWQKHFGQVPRLRAALHGGPIITAEIGVDHHKITYFGDTVNTAARLESLCKTMDRQVLISTDLFQRLRVPDMVTVENLGSHAIKGRGQELGVMALAVRSEIPVLAPFERRIAAG